MEHYLVLLLIFGGGTLVAISFSPVGRAIADRIRGGTGELAPDPVLYEEMERLRAELSEMGERVDFTERLLAAKRESRELAEGA